MYNIGVQIMDDHRRLRTLNALLDQRDRLRECLAQAWEKHRPRNFIGRIENALWDTWQLIDEAEARDERSGLMSSRRDPLPHAKCA